MLFTINNSLNGVGKIIFEHYHIIYIICITSLLKYIICLVSPTKAQYEPGHERMLLLGYFFLYFY